VLSPFLLQLKPNLRPSVLLGGAFVSLGYVSQSIALIDTSPATVSFLGSCTVIVCPLLQWLVNKKPMGIKDAPQTWLAAFLCLSGVATLELFDASSSASTFSFAESMSRLGVGDALSLVQAVGFGVGIFMSEKMMKEEPEAALPITAGMVATTAFFSMLWCFADGWMKEPGWESLGLPGLFLDPNMRSVALAVAWTGILSTSTNFCIEITALGRVPSSEASVILATEPLWASLFAAILLHEQFGTNDYIGGVLMVSACLVNTLRPSYFRDLFGVKNDGNEATDRLLQLQGDEGDYETM
jgi:drug/metabolite transporter (DMT)-like permease